MLISRVDDTALGWDYATFDPEIIDFQTDVPSGDTVTITLSSEVGWTPLNSKSIEDWIYVEDDGQNEVVHTYSNGVYQFVVPSYSGYLNLHVYLFAEPHPPLKIKKLFEKITTAIKGTNEIGQCAEIYGKNSAGTGDCSLQKQTYQNPLAGQCYGRLYNRSNTDNITSTTATTTEQSNDLFVVTPSTGKIKVLKKGNYLVEGSVYGYSGFTAEDRLDIRIQVDGVNYAALFRRERMSSTYQIIFISCMMEIKANEVLNLAVSNYEAARGIVTSSSTTMLQVVKLDG